MRYEIVQEFPHNLMYEGGDICISLYQPTHRHTEGTKQDLIVFKNQLRKIERSLASIKSQTEIEAFLAPLYALQGDLNFWNNTKDGMALLMNQEKCIIYNLFRDIKELVVVSDNFHIKPLLRVYQSTDKYYVLGINRQTFSLYYGDRYGLNLLEFPADTPIKLEDVLGDQYTDAHLGRASSRGPAGTTTSTHGYGGKKDEVRKDVEKYFRYVDRLIYNEYSKPTKAPLILACLNENQGIFREISHNHYLLETGIMKDFQSMDKEEIQVASWKIVETLYLARTKKLVDEFQAAKSNGHASDDIGIIANGVAENRVATVLLESDKIVLGALNKETGHMDIHATSELVDVMDFKARDLLDNIAAKVMAAGGEVVMLPKERMPSDTGAAAIFRY